MVVGSLLLILVAVALLVVGVLGAVNIAIVCSIVATMLAAIVLIIGVRQSVSGDDASDNDDDAGIDQVTAVVENTRRSGRPSRSESGHRSDVRDPAQPSRALASRETSTRETVSGSNQVLIEEPSGRGSIPNQGAAGRRDRFDVDGTEAEPFEAPANEGSTREGSGHEGSGHEGSTREGSTREGSGHEGSGHEAAAPAVDEDSPDEPPAQVVSPSDARRVALLTAEVLVIDGRPRYHVSSCVRLLGRVSEPLAVAEAVELGFTPCGLCEPDSALLAEARGV